MILKCKLDSLLNLQLASYFSPSKFNFNELQNNDNKLIDIKSLFISSLKTDIHTYDIHLDSDVLYLTLYNDNIIDKFATRNLTSYDVEQINIETANGKCLITFITTEAVSYPLCMINNLTYVSDKLYSLICTPYNSKGDSYIVYDGINFKICMVESETVAKNIVKKVLM